MKYINKYIILLLIIALIALIAFICSRVNKQHKKCLVMFDTHTMKKLYHKYGISYNIVNGYTELTKKSGIKDKTIKLCDINNKNAINISRNKLESQGLFKKHNINISNFLKWNNNKSDKENITNINNNLTFPLVIKYSKGTMGTDVYTNIYNNKKILNIIKKLKNEKKNEIIIEEFQQGYRYRIYILNNTIIFIEKFYPPIIVGDGKSSVSELINNYTTHTYNPMKYELQPISHIEEHLIEEQGYYMDSILEQNKKIQITGIITYSNGAIMENIPISSVHFNNQKMFLNVNKIVGLNLSGIDFISENISTPYIGKVLEVNAAPSYNPEYHSDKTNKKLLDSLFK